jgi:hypothetical protein
LCGRTADTVSGQLYSDGDARRRISATADDDLIGAISPASAADPAALYLAVADDLYNYTLQLRKGRSGDICR